MIATEVRRPWPSRASQAATDLRKEYGCDAEDFIATDDVLYERHRAFEHVVSPVPCVPAMFAPGLNALSGAALKSTAYWIWSTT